MEMIVILVVVGAAILSVRPLKRANSKIDDIVVAEVDFPRTVASIDK
jgi:hypothetical protein